MSSEPTNLATIYDDTTKLHPERVAVIDENNKRRVTYGEFSDNVAKAGNVLQNHDIGKGDRVAILLSTGLPYLHVFFGAMRIGAVPVPVNIQSPVSQQGHVLQDSDSKVAVTEPKHAISGKNEMFENSKIAQLGVFGRPDRDDLMSREWFSFKGKMENASSTLSPASVEEDDPSVQPYTSGSTGQPKGVVLSHGGEQWNIKWYQKLLLFEESDRGLVATPLYHKNAMHGAIKPLLRAGGSVVLMDDFDPNNVIKNIEKHQVNFITGVPAMFKMIISATDALQRHDVSSVKWVECGSANVPESLSKEFYDVFDFPLGTGYGLTEGGPVVTLSPRWGIRKMTSSGLPLPGVETKIIDPETGSELPAGDQGELIVTNPGLGHYYKKPERNEEAFEERNGVRYLRTRDLAWKDSDGYHYITGRVDNMLVVGGENVYPEEVEGLVEKHPSVQNCAVIGVPHSVKGEAPVAFVEAESFNEKEIKDYSLEHAPAYAHPRRIFDIKKIPLTGVGKPDKDALAEDARNRLEGQPVDQVKSS
jgi:acyl-CoA synthetase (AMP-forming)/AMP-acid ligase II